MYSKVKDEGGMTASLSDKGRHGVSLGHAVSFWGYEPVLANYRSQQTILYPIPCVTLLHYSFTHSLCLFFLAT
jgi:hypothetical protein